MDVTKKTDALAEDYIKAFESAKLLEEAAEDSLESITRKLNKQKWIWIRFRQLIRFNCRNMGCKHKQP